MTASRRCMVCGWENNGKSPHASFCGGEVLDIPRTTKFKIPESSINPGSTWTVDPDSIDALAETFNGVCDITDDGDQFVHWGTDRKARAYFGDAVHVVTKDQINILYGTGDSQRANRTGYYTVQFRDWYLPKLKSSFESNSFPESVARAHFGLPDKTEVRTTSSSGGQKGVKAERYDLIPVFPLQQLAIHYGRGAKKYADNQWRKGFEWGKAMAALQRHLAAFWAGEDYDFCPKNNPSGCVFNDDFPAIGNGICLNHTGGHHLDAAMWQTFTLREFAEFNPEFDDRYKKEN